MTEKLQQNDLESVEQTYINLQYLENKIDPEIHFFLP